MAAKDKYDDIVRDALEKDGWTITDDPLKLKAEGRNIKIDLGAEKLIGAEKGNEKIAVEVKRFLGLSELDDLYKAMGQFNYYHFALEAEQPYRTLFLAIPIDTYKGVFKESLTIKAFQKIDMKILVYDILEKKLRHG